MLPPSGIRTFLNWSRAAEWWEFKLLPCIMVAYGTSLHLGATPIDILPALGILLLALVPGALYVSLVNDLTDLADDARAGKHNRLAGSGRTVPLLLCLASLLAGGLVAWSLRDSPMILAVYAAGWIAYSLYSLPPFRLKTRGLAGAICDAVGANVAPSLLGSLLVARGLGVQLEAPWLAAVGVWSLCFGLRGIFWHQIGDLAADLRSGASTFVVRWGQAATMTIARLVVFPLEVVALGVWVAQTGLAAVLAGAIAIAAYAWLVHERLDRLGMCFTIVKPRPRSFILLHEVYDVFLPLAFLVVSLVWDWRALAVLGLHLVLFPMRWRQVVDDLVLLRDPRFQRRK